MDYHGVNILDDRLAEFCRLNHIRKLSLFGSILREDFGPDSDIDILVEFEPDHVPGFGFIRLQDELSAMLGHKVDMVTPKFLNRRIRQSVMEQAEVCYEQR